MVALALVGAVWAESTQTGDGTTTQLALPENWIVDESIAAPHDVQIAREEGSLVRLEWGAVEGATSYRIFRQRWISYRLSTPEDDTEDAIVRLEVPEAVWVPLSKSDAIPGAEKVIVVVHTLDNVVSTFGVRTVVEKDGTVFLSPITLADWVVTPPTAVAQRSWGQIKDGSR